MRNVTRTNVEPIKFHVTLIASNLQLACNLLMLTAEKGTQYFHAR